MATVLSVTSSAVSISGVTDAPGRRRLAAGSVAVAFSVVTSSSSAASGVASSITAVTPASFVAVLQNSGLLACTGVAMSAPVVVAPAPLNASSIDAGAVATRLSTLNASTASTMQDVLLVSLSSTSVVGNLSAADAASTASLVLAVVNATASLSVASQDAALSILTAVASAPINISGGVAQSITSALSAVASSAVTGNQVALLQVQSVLNNLASSQASSLAATLAALPPGAPPPEPAVTNSSTIQTRVQIDPPGGSRLTTQPLTAPGSPSSFQPMPAGLLPTDTPIVTHFFSLAFDPNSANSTLNTTGVTRLAFSNLDGSPIPVANATTPVSFTLPRVDTGAEDQAVCSFWDPAAGAYATHGCIGVPNPSPPGHRVFFRSGFTNVTSDAVLAEAWVISGPMVDGGLCSVKMLDCNLDSLGVVYPDPRNPLATPAVACPPRLSSTNLSSAAANGTAGNATTPTARRPVLRVYYGTQCSLWRSGNAVNCSWDNVKQAFVGGGCVVSSGPTQCLCRHLTDFASARVPKISTCSLNDMTSLSPGEAILT